MDNPILIRRGSEILIALIVAVLAMIFISTNPPYSATVYRALTADFSGQENKITQPEQDTKGEANSDKKIAGTAELALEGNSEIEMINAQNIPDNAVEAEEILPGKQWVDSAEMSEPVYRYVLANWLNLRSGPDSGTEKLGTLPYGTRVQMLEHRDEWMKVRTPDNMEVFVYAEYVSDTIPPVYHYVNVNLLNVRSGPGSENEKISTLERGSRVQVLDKQGEWIKVITKENLEGFVYAPYVVANESLVSRAATAQPYNSGTAATVIEYAKQFVGVPYVYGGSSPKGFDCSGFTKYVYGKFKILLPRASESYSGVGTKVSRTDLKPGDILLFDRYGSNRLGHVGIYLGKDQFIHASSSLKKVVIMSLTKYNGKFLGARRVIK